MAPTLNSPGGGAPAPPHMFQAAFEWRVWLGHRPNPATGTGWGFDSNYTTWTNTGDYFPRYTDSRSELGLNGVGVVDALVDITGDSRPDLIHAYEQPDGSYIWTIYPNTGAGFGSPYTFPNAKGPVEFTEVGGISHKRIALADINGDGLPDQI